MRTLEAEAGGATAAAARVGWAQSYWSNLRSGAPDSRTGKRRGCSSVLGVIVQRLA